MIVKGNSSLDYARRELRVDQMLYCAVQTIMKTVDTLKNVAKDVKSITAAANACARYPPFPTKFALLASFLERQVIHAVTVAANKCLPR